MSQINVNVIKDSNEGAPDFPSGVNVSGVTSTVTLGVTNLNPTNVNVSGVVTATTLDGNLLATGTPTLGLGVTINTSGLNISGVATAGIVSATTLYGNGSNLTGIALTIAPLNYNPAVSGVNVDTANGIGLTFNQGVKAGSGNVTLRLVGAAGTVVENFGVGNSVTYGHSDYGTTVSINPTADLEEDTVYHLNYPSGAFTTIGGDVSYVGTAYTFDSVKTDYQLWAWGFNGTGALGQNTRNTSVNGSPVQVPGLTWRNIAQNGARQAYNTLAVRSDGTLWAWGSNQAGELGLNSIKGWPSGYSSPVQVPGTTWSADPNTNHLTVSGNYGSGAIKTDGTLWMWGDNSGGKLGINDVAKRSSPAQIPGTTWKSIDFGGSISSATKTDGTLWSWGSNTYGGLGQNSRTQYSSPVQIPGTTWAIVKSAQQHFLATKTDGTLWAWGANNDGQLGQNAKTNLSSPTQIPGTTWSTNLKDLTVNYDTVGAIKTDGTLWMWGDNYYGATTSPSSGASTTDSPIQVPGTSWHKVGGGTVHVTALKKIES